MTAVAGVPAQIEKSRTPAATPIFAIKLGALNCFCMSQGPRNDQHELYLAEEDRPSLPAREDNDSSLRSARYEAPEVEEELGPPGETFRGESAPLTAAAVVTPPRPVPTHGWPPREVPAILSPKRDAQNSGAAKPEGSSKAASSSSPALDHSQHKPADIAPEQSNNRSGSEQLFSAAAPRGETPQAAANHRGEEGDSHGHEDTHLAVGTDAILYLNIVVKQNAHNIESVVNQTISEKLPEHAKGTAMFQHFAHMGSLIATNLVSFDKVGTKMAESIPGLVTNALEAMRIEAEALEVFSHGTFTVLRLTVHQCSTDKQTGETHRKEGCCKGKACVSAPVNKQKAKQARKRETEEAMLTLLPKVLPKKLAEAGSQVDVFAMDESHQAMFFFHFLKQLERPKETPRPDAPPSTPAASEFPSFFLNMIVHSKTPEFEESVKEQMKAKAPSVFGQGVLPGLAARAVVKLITTDKLAETLAKRMSMVLPLNMRGMGIEAEAEEVYRKGSFVIVRVCIKHVDFKVIAEAKGAVRAAKNIEKGMNCISCFSGLSRICGGTGAEFEAKVNETICKKVMEKMTKTLPIELPKKMGEKGLQIAVAAKNEFEEASYFFGVFRQLQAHQTEVEAVEQPSQAAVEPPRKFRRFFSRLGFHGHKSNAQPN